jgi:hypothetical protein
MSEPSPDPNPGLGDQGRRRRALTRSIREYHTMLHSIFVRAVRDQLVLANPCAQTDLPKVIVKTTRTLTPDEYSVLAAAIPEAYRLLVQTTIETGMRWGELIALKPPTSTFCAAPSRSQDTIIEVSKEHPRPANATSPSPTPRTTSPAPSPSAMAGSTRLPSTSSGKGSVATIFSSRRNPGRLSQGTPFGPGLATRRKGISGRLRGPDARPAPTPPSCSPAVPTSNP